MLKDQVKIQTLDRDPTYIYSNELNTGGNKINFVAQYQLYPNMFSKWIWNSVTVIENIIPQGLSNAFIFNVN